MSLPNELLPVGLLGTGAAGGYEIERSLRFNSADSAYLSKTFSTFTSRTVGTISFWFKLGKLSVFRTFAAGWDGGVSYSGSISLANTDTLFVGIGGAAEYGFRTNAVFRDPSAWYHVVVAWNQGASSVDRVKVWVNGVSQTSSDTGYQSWSSGNCQIFCPNTANRIGRGDGDRYGNFLDGYLAEYFFIDGQALDPTSFGEFDESGIWQPVEYTGEYGTNGFHLPFSDNSSASALGTDTSGNENDWTVNNLSIGSPYYTARLSSNTTSIVNPQNLFDGSTSTFTTGAVGGTITFTPSPFIQCNSTLRVYMEINRGQKIFVNGSELLSSVSAGWNNVPVSAPLTITSIAIGPANAGSSNNPSAIEVDGTILVDSSTGNDSLIDVPTNGTQTDTGLGGEVRGNYATLNPLFNGAGSLSNGNLVMTGPTSAWGSRVSTIAVSSGKWYFECIGTTDTASQGVIVGILKVTGSTSGNIGSDANGYGYYSITGLKYNNSPTGSSYGNTWGDGDVIGCAFDVDGGTVTFYKNNVSQGVAFSSLSATAWFLGISCYGTASANVNFGQRPFAYQAPEGYKALNTANLPTPTILDGSEYMDVVTYTGNGSTQTISGLEFSPDLVWIKNRAQADNHKLLDTVRGATNELESNTTDGEVANADGLTAFNSDGFALGADVEYNTNNEAYVAWAWDAGSSTVTNTDGTITSQVRASPSAGFSAITYTGNGSTGTVGHGLGVAPQLIIYKIRGGAGFTSSSWQVYHVSLGATKYLNLDTTDASTTGSTRWNDTAPTSSVVSLGTNGAASFNYVMYCFAPVSSYSSFGSYTGNGSTDGPFVYLGFRPRFLLWKSSSYSTGDTNWVMFDSARSPYNRTVLHLRADLGAAEASGSEYIDLCSNGFKLRYVDANNNANGQTYIYAAFAENPFSVARAR